MSRLLFALVSVLVLGAAPALADGPLTLVTSAPAPSVAHDVARQGDFFYVATDGGVTVVDISVPDAPVTRGSLTTSTGTTGVKVRGQYAYMAGRTAGLRVIDV